MNQLKNLVLDEKDSVKKALNLIEKNGLGSCFVTSGNVFKTVITDGDIRKLVIKKKNLNLSIKNFFNKKRGIALNINTPEIEIYKKLSDKTKIIPLIDENKNILSYSTIKNLKKINLYDINLEGNEFNYVSDCLKTNWISSIGKYVELFEKKFRNFFNYKLSLTTSSGTTALHLALQVLDIKRGDEVIVPNLTFASPINSIIMSGAKPVIVDIDEKTYNIDANEIKKKITKRTKAIICVHLYGQACNLEELLKIKKKNQIFLIEDCAEALGTKYKGKYVGNFGDISTFSFYGNKTITTGEGGMLVTSNKKFYDKAKILRAHGMNPKKRYWHDLVGFNYRMTNLQAAVGLAQMEKANIIIKKKIQIANYYNFEIDKLNKEIKEKIIVPQANKNIVNSYWLYNVRIKDIDYNLRDKILNFLEIKGINGRTFFYPLSEMKIYKKYSNSNSEISNKISKSGLCLPSSTNLKKSEIKYIVKNLSKAINQFILN